MSLKVAVGARRVLHKPLIHWDFHYITTISRGLQLLKIDNLVNSDCEQGNALLMPGVIGQKWGDCPWFYHWTTPTNKSCKDTTSDVQKLDMSI